MSMRLRSEQAAVASFAGARTAVIDAAVQDSGRGARHSSDALVGGRSRPRPIPSYEPAGGDGIYAYATRQASATASCSASPTEPVRRGEDSRAGVRRRPRAADWSSRSRAARSRSRARRSGSSGRGFLQERRPYLTKGSFVDSRRTDASGCCRRSPRRRSRGSTRGCSPLAAAMVDGRERRDLGQDDQQRAHMPLGRAQRGEPAWVDPPQPVRGGTCAAGHRRELDYLRLDEIEGYLEACAALLRLLARFLVGTGARISEAVGVRFGTSTSTTASSGSTGNGTADTDASRPTKGKRFRSVQIGPGLAAASPRRKPPAAPRRRIGCSSARRRDAAATPPGASRYRRAAGRCTTGTRRRWSTPGFATCHCTPCGTRRPQRGSRPPCADLRSAPAWASLDHHDGGALRPPRDVVHARGGRTDREHDQPGIRREPSPGLAGLGGHESFGGISRS